MSLSRHLLSFTAALVGLVVALVLPAVAGAQITKFPVPNLSGGAGGIVAGPDGSLWFTETAGKIGRVTTAGTVTEFPVPWAGAELANIAAGPDGALWFTDPGAAKIGRITTGGSVTQFSVPGQPNDIAAGPDGALWFTEFNAGRIGRITTGGRVTEFTIPTPNGAGSGIAAGPDGALWFSEEFAGRIGRITTAGAITDFPLPNPNATPGDIAAGPDGALWFTEASGIGRITTGGSVTEYPVFTPLGSPTQITSGPDGALWFSEEFAGKIGRITTSGGIGEFRGAGAPAGITSGPDGALWFTDALGSIGRIAAAPAPPEDSVLGLIHTEPPCPFPVCIQQPRYIFDVSSGTSGENPVGSVKYQTGERAGEQTETGSVSCVYVSGKRATVGVEFAGFAFPPRAEVIFLEDNGSVTQDRFGVQRLPAGSAPTTCPQSPPAGITLGPAYPGVGGGTEPGVTITDTQPPPKLPTTRNQCRGAGWRAFGLKSQAQCFAVVRFLGLASCLKERNTIGRPAFRQKYGAGKLTRHPLRRCIRLRIGP